MKKIKKILLIIYPAILLQVQLGLFYNFPPTHHEFHKTQVDFVYPPDPDKAHSVDLNAQVAVLSRTTEMLESQNPA